MSRRNVRRITLCLGTILAILGCGTPALVTPPPSAPGVGSLETIIAQTAEAAQTATAIFLPPSATPSLTPPPTKTSTITPTPTATILFLIKTNTSVPTATSSFIAGGSGTGTGGGSSGSGNSGGGFVKPTATPQEWTCRVLYKSPDKALTIYGGSKVKTTWTVQNTGTKTWPKDGVDVVYQSGARLNAGKPYYDIPTGVGPGGSVTISVTMEMPKRPKEYSTRWSLMVGHTEFCSVRFVFDVQ